MTQRRETAIRTTAIEPRDVAIRQSLTLENTHAGHDIQTFVDEGTVGCEADEVNLHGEEGSDDPPQSPRAALRAWMILGTSALVASAQRSIISIWERADRRRQQPLEPSRFHANPVFRREVDSQDCVFSISMSASPLDHRGSRRIGGHPALPDVGLDMVVTEGDVASAGVTQFVGEYRRRPLPPLP